MKITWYGHSCFKIEENDYSIVIDPYDNKMLPWFKPLHLVCNEVLISHEHLDHSYVAGIMNPRIFVPSPFKVEVIETYHDNEQGKLRGLNKIHIIESNKYKLAHLGDLGTINLSEEALNKISNLDALMIPIGGYYTIDKNEAAKLIDRIKPRIILPMHYKSESGGFDVIDTISGFLDKFESSTKIDKNYIELDDNIEGVIVLSDKF